MESAKNILPLFATRYLSAAGLTVLIYDHIVLFDREVQCVWKAKGSWFKWLYIYNHYSVLLFLIINSLALGPWIVSSQFCATWFPAALILSIASLGIINIFMANRLYILWGSNKRVLKVLCFVYAAAYSGSFVASAMGIKRTAPSITYDSIAKMCLPLVISPLVAVGCAIPLMLELLNFVLLCWNALDRPRHLQTLLIKQLYMDGIIFFLAVSALRTVNIIIFASVSPDQSKLLFAFFMWEMVPVIVHRLLLTLNDNVGDKPTESEYEYLGEHVKRRLSSGFQPATSITSSSMEITGAYNFTNSIL